MSSPWVAVDLAGDRIAHARLLRRAHEVVLSGSGTPPVLRDVIVRSWERCTEAGVDPTGRPRYARRRRGGRALRAAPARRVAPLVRDLLDAVSAEARHLVVVSDAEGCCCGCDGHPRMLEAARGPHFTPGALVSEPGIGTNAVGTALALDHAVQVFSAEHYNRLLHGWSCAAAPVHDPVTGAILGVIDLSGSFRTAHPHTLALVRRWRARPSSSSCAIARRSDAELVARYVDRCRRPGGVRAPWSVRTAGCSRRPRGLARPVLGPRAARGPDRAAGRH